MAMLHIRPAAENDIADITALHRAYDTAWFGAPEHDEDEVREWLELADERCVVSDGARLAAAGTRWRNGSTLVVDPAVRDPAVHRLLMRWLLDAGALESESLDRDLLLTSALRAIGWRHTRSSFELVRRVTSDWVLSPPAWPVGIELRPYRAADAEPLHHLVYVDAGWADVPGHEQRSFAEWQRIFLAGRAAEEAPILAWRGTALAGAAIGRMFSDGTGWVSQLAVARNERRAGLGRALLLEALRRRVAAGATSLGLGVSATNRHALGLYLSVGLHIDREWQTFAP
jgi:GNAT superfamily N-acetyltransferase